MTSKKHRKAMAKAEHKKKYFDEQYEVHFTNGKSIIVYVEVEFGAEKRSHHKAAAIAQEKHPDLQVLKTLYC